MDAINWDSELTESEKEALAGTDVRSLSPFYQKLLANVRIQKKRLGVLTGQFKSCANLKCGGIEKVEPGRMTDGKTRLTFTYEGDTKSAPEIPHGEDVSSVAPGIIGVSCKACTNVKGGYDYTIVYGANSASVDISTAKGADGKNGKADDGTEYYDNGAVKRKNSVTGLSISGPSIVKASITGMDVSATGISLSLFAVSLCGVALYNSSSIKTVKGYITNNYPKGAYLKMKTG